MIYTSCLQWMPRENTRGGWGALNAGQAWNSNLYSDKYSRRSPEGIPPSYPQENGSEVG